MYWFGKFLVSYEKFNTCSVLSLGTWTIFETANSQTTTKYYSDRSVTISRYGYESPMSLIIEYTNGNLIDFNSWHHTWSGAISKIINVKLGPCTLYTAYSPYGCLAHLSYGLYSMLFTDCCCYIKKDTSCYKTGPNFTNIEPMLLEQYSSIASRYDLESMQLAE